VLRAFGFSGPEITPDLVTTEGHIRFGVPPMRIELLMNVDGVDFGDCYARRQCISIDGVLVNVIAKPDLIANKRASGRLKDLADIEELTGY
jgi:hypothetical protein